MNTWRLLPSADRAPISRATIFICVASALLAGNVVPSVTPDSALVTWPSAVTAREVMRLYSFSNVCVRGC